METKAHHVLVGFFAVFLVLAGAFFAMWLGKVSFDREYAVYDIVFDGPVRGLRESGEVRFNGIQVGEVTNIGLDPQNPNRVISRVRVISETPVRVDSSAQLEPQGLTGLAYVQITGGTPQAQRLYSPPGRTPPRIYAVPAQLESLVQGSENVLIAANSALIRVAALLSEDNVERVSSTLDNLDRLTSQLVEQDALIEDTRRVLASLDQAARDMSGAAVALDDFGRAAETLVEGDLAVMVQETTQAAISVDLASRETQQMLAELQPNLSRFANEGLDDLTLAASDLRRLIETLERIAAELETDPGGFVAGQPRERMEVRQ